MRLPSYRSPPRARQRAFVRLTRASGGELDDVGKVCLRRPGFFGRPFLQFAHSLLRGPSTWSVGERELFAAVVSRANSCQFCVGTHAEIAERELGRDAIARLDEGAMTPRASAAAAFAEALTRDPNALSAAAVERARAAGVEDDALAEVAYVVFMFNTVNRIADALGFEHRSDRHRRRGAAVLRRIGYRLPAFLQADERDRPAHRQVG
jgi:uncharacterized peroxidase-related enzyme